MEIVDQTSTTLQTWKDFEINKCSLVEALDWIKWQTVAKYTPLFFLWYQKA